MSLVSSNASSSLQTPTCSPKSFVSVVKHPTEGECHKCVVGPSIKRDSHTSQVEFDSQKLTFDKIHHPTKRTEFVKQENCGKREGEKLLRPLLLEPHHSFKFSYMNNTIQAALVYFFKGFDVLSGQFLWSGNLHSSKWSLISWETVCRAKKEGVLVFDQLS